MVGEEKMRQLIKKILRKTLFKQKKVNKKESKIFNPKSKIIANADRVIEHINTGFAPPVLIEVDPSNACNHACNFCLSSYIHFEKYKGTETFSRAIMPRDMLMNLCQDFVDMGVRAVNWTGGGEPTLNKHLKEARILWSKWYKNGNVYQWNSF